MVGSVDFRPRKPAEGDLTGLWRAAPATLELKRTGADADLDDSGWQALEVPGHWGQHPALADHDGPILHRRRFRHRIPEPDERLWLRFDGVLSGAEVWLDGSYVGDTTSYFASHRYDVTRHLADSFDHLLAVDVSSPAPGDDRRKSTLTGSLQTGHLAPAGNPGGIWRDVAIDSTGPVAIRYSRLLCTKASTEAAEIVVRLVLDAAVQTEIRLDTSVVGPDGVAAGGNVERHDLASGENRIEWTVRVERPALWWPAALGGQPLYEVAVAVRLADGRLSDRRDWRTGLREVRVDNFIWRINGSRLFTKGIVYGPPDRFLNNVTEAALVKDMAAARDAGLDLVRVYGHIGRKELYDEADRQGLLIWQDLPMIGGYSSKVRSSARAMARQAVDQLGHHPSVGLWCGHIEPNGRAVPEPHSALRQPNRSGRTAGGPAERDTAGGPAERDTAGGPAERDTAGGPAERDTAGGPAERDTAGGPAATGTGPPPDGGDRPPGPGTLHRSSPARPSAARRLVRHLLPSWNRSILDPIVSRELRNADRTRPIVARSGSLPSPGDPAGSDAHLWLGWHAGRAEDLGRILHRWPRLGTFLGGIGSQSVSLQSWDERAPTWPGAERGAFNRYLPRRAYGDGRSWARATRSYQGDLLRVQIETIRRLKYRPAGGFCVTALADVAAEGGFGVFDVARHPKPALNVLIDACRPVVVIAEPPPALTVPGQEVSVPVWVVSDRREPLHDVRVTAVAHTNPPDDATGERGEERPWRRRTVWQGDLPADCCQWVGDLRFTTPAGPGAIQIDLQLESSELLATNRYRTVVIPPSEAIPHGRTSPLR